jgi:hypothetical protein
MRQWLNIPGLTVGLYLLWKVALLIFFSQPVPSNDAFFYDGPVVNQLLHGDYCNPSLVPVLPISGSEVFSAYPPLYQGVLWGWMSVFGPSVGAALWLHLILIVVFAMTLLQILKQLGVSPALANLAGLFLFGITFNDRPDTLAHVLGALAVLGLVRRLPWATAVFLMLAFCTSLQIGGVYSLWLAGFLLAEVRWGGEKIPWAAMAALVLGLGSLVFIVKLGHPRWWAGFCEHLAITPSVTGWRVPRVDDLLKIVRGTPGILLVGLLLGCNLWWRPDGAGSLFQSRGRRLAVSGLLAALALLGGCLFILTPNTIHIAGYLQPIIVGSFLVGAGERRSGDRRSGLPVRVAFAAALALLSVRAVGMSTWGILCARDVSRSDAQREINTQLDAVPVGSTVFVSSAYLYDVARRTNITWLHSDWVAPSHTEDWELAAINNLRPAKLLLTQFDYYRRYERVVSEFQKTRGDVAVEIINLARVQPPDAIPATRKIVQHIAWAPVVITLEWPTNIANAPNAWRSLRRRRATTDGQN